MVFVISELEDKDKKNEKNEIQHTHRPHFEYHHSGNSAITD